MKMKGLLLAILSCMFLSAVAITASSNPKEHRIVVGKHGEITLAEAMKVEDRVLEPGTYLVQHRESHGDHFVRFLELKVRDYSLLDTWSSDTYTAEDNAGEINAELNLHRERLKQTTVYTVTEDGTKRITKVTIRGENVVHVF